MSDVTLIILFAILVVAIIIAVFVLAKTITNQNL